MIIAENPSPKTSDCFLKLSNLEDSLALVLEIHYVEHGRVFVAYKEKQDAKKAMDIMKLAQKYFFRPKYIKPKDRSETTQRTTKINKVSVSNFYQNQKNNLTMSIHEGQRNYKCDSCGKYFT